LSRTYPDNKIISDDDFLFIAQMFSDINFMAQKSFFEFICVINILGFANK